MIRDLLTWMCVMTLGLIGLSLIVTPDAEAHATPPWKCKYLEAPDGWLQYPWQQQKCRPFRVKHTNYHTHGWLWPCKIQPQGPSRNECVIRKLFGKEGGVALANKAVHVARCESTLRRHAANGQYLGLFQMGSNERATYGYGSTAVEQVQGALRYYRVSHWSPWGCA